MTCTPEQVAEALVAAARPVEVRCAVCRVLLRIDRPGRRGARAFCGVVCQAAFDRAARAIGAAYLDSGAEAAAEAHSRATAHFPRSAAAEAQGAGEAAPSAPGGAEQ